MKVRRSSSADNGLLFDIWNRAVLATHDFVSAEDLETFRCVVRDDYLPDALVDVAVDSKDVPIGFMGMTGANIDALFVDPDVHGKGVGRFLIAVAKKRFADGLTLNVNEQNSGAVGFYERLGFRVVDRSPVDDTGKPYPLLTMSWP